MKKPGLYFLINDQFANLEMCREPGNIADITSKTFLQTKLINVLMLLMFTKCV